MAVRRAFEPSMMNSLRRVGSIPWSTRCLEQILGGLGILGRALTQRQHVLAPLKIPAHRRQHALMSKVHSIHVDDQQLDFIETSLH